MPVDDHFGRMVDGGGASLKNLLTAQQASSLEKAGRSDAAYCPRISVLSESDEPHGSVSTRNFDFYVLGQGLRLI